MNHNPKFPLSSLGDGCKNVITHERVKLNKAQAAIVEYPWSKSINNGSIGGMQIVVFPTEKKQGRRGDEQEDESQRKSSH